MVRAEINTENTQVVIKNFNTQIVKLVLIRLHDYQLTLCFYYQGMML